MFNIAENANINFVVFVIRINVFGKKTKVVDNKRNRGKIALSEKIEMHARDLFAPSMIGNHTGGNCDVGRKEKKSRTFRHGYGR